MLLAILMIQEDVICPITAPFLKDNVCVRSCEGNAYNIVDSDLKCKSECLGQSQNAQYANGITIRYKICIPCTAEKPFFEPQLFICTESCISQTADSQKKCQLGCPNNHYKDTSIQLTSRTVNYQLCLICENATPFYNMISQSCVANCGSSNQILVTPKKICTSFCPIKQQQTIGKINYTECSSCPSDKPFYHDEQCKNNCGGDTMLTDANLLCIKSCQGEKELINIGPTPYSICRNCSANKPFYDETKSTCVSVCTFNHSNISITNDPTKCSLQECGAPNHFYLSQTPSLIPYYQCVSTCPTNNSSNQICKTCEEINASKPFYDTLVSGCLSSCPFKISGFSVVNISNICQDKVDSSQFLEKIHFLNDITSNYFLQRTFCPSNQTILDLETNTQICNPCSNVNGGLLNNYGKCDGICQLQVQYNGESRNLVDINNVCLAPAECNLENFNIFNHSSILTIFCIPKAPFYSTKNIKTLDTCDKIWFNQGAGVQFCADFQEIIPVSNLIKLESNQTYAVPSLTTSCPSDTIQIQQVCALTTSCITYSDWCTNASLTENPYCKSQFKQNNQCFKQCQGNAIYDNTTKVCSDCNATFVDENTCVNQCPEKKKLVEDKKCVDQCTLFLVNRIPVIDNKTSPSVCKQYNDVLNNYLLRNTDQYVIVPSCARTNDTFYHEVVINDLQKVNVCVKSCSATEGQLNQSIETQCIDCKLKSFVNDNGLCVPKCSTERPFNSSWVCTAQCDHFNFVDEQANQICYISCLQNKYFVLEDQKTCAVSCASNLYSADIIQNEHVCVASCSTEQFNELGACRKACTGTNPFHFSNNVCTSTCNTTNVPLVSQQLLCLNSCEQFIDANRKQSSEGVIYDVCVDQCTAGVQVLYQKMCFDNCNKAGWFFGADLFTQNSSCVGACPDNSFKTENNLKICVITNIPDAAYNGVAIGLGAFFGIVAIAIIIVPTTVILIKKRKNQLDFKNPFPASPIPAKKPLKSPVKINLGQLQEQINSGKFEDTLTQRDLAPGALNMDNQNVI